MPGNTTPVDTKYFNNYMPRSALNKLPAAIPEQIMPAHQSPLINIEVANFQGERARFANCACCADLRGSNGSAAQLKRPSERRFTP